ncbi:Elongin-A [Manis pentadactyla]|nr:Elongin-A [Manis pentadactyla]
MAYVQSQGEFPKNQIAEETHRTGRPSTPDRMTLKPGGMPLGKENLTKEDVELCYLLGFSNATLGFFLLLFFEETF